MARIGAFQRAKNTIFLARGQGSSTQVIHLSASTSAGFLSPQSQRKWRAPVSGAVPSEMPPHGRMSARRYRAIFGSPRVDPLHVRLDARLMTRRDRRHASRSPCQSAHFPQYTHIIIYGELRISLMHLVEFRDRPKSQNANLTLLMSSCVDLAFCLGLGRRECWSHLRL